MCQSVPLRSKKQLSYRTNESQLFLKQRDETLKILRCFACFSSRTEGQVPWLADTTGPHLHQRSRCSTLARRCRSPAATKHSLIYMIIRGCGARRDNKGETREQCPAVARRQGDARCNLKQGKDKGGGRRTARFGGGWLHNEAVDNKVQTTAYCEGEIFVEWILMLKRRWNRRGGKEWRCLRRQARAGVSGAWLRTWSGSEWIAEFLFHVYCTFEQTWPAMQSKNINVAWR